MYKLCQTSVLYNHALVKHSLPCPALYSHVSLTILDVTKFSFYFCMNPNEYIFIVWLKHGEGSFDLTCRHNYVNYVLVNGKWFIYKAPLIQSALHRLCITFTHSHTHSYTGGGGNHARHQRYR